MHKLSLSFLCFLTAAVVSLLPNCITQKYNKYRRIVVPSIKVCYNYNIISYNFQHFKLTIQQYNMIQYNSQSNHRKFTGILHTTWGFYTRCKNITHKELKKKREHYDRTALLDLIRQLIVPTINCTTCFIVCKFHLSHFKHGKIFKILSKLNIVQNEAVTGSLTNILFIGQMNLLPNTVQ